MLIRDRTTKSTCIRLYQCMTESLVGSRACQRHGVADRRTSLLEIRLGCGHSFVDYPAYTPHPRRPHNRPQRAGRLRRSAAPSDLGAISARTHRDLPPGAGAPPSALDSARSLAQIALVDRRALRRCVPSLPRTPEHARRGIVVVRALRSRRRVRVQRGRLPRLAPRDRAVM